MRGCVMCAVVVSVYRPLGLCWTSSLINTICRAERGRDSAGTHDRAEFSTAQWNFHWPRGILNGLQESQLASKKPPLPTGILTSLVNPLPRPSHKRPGHY